MKVSVVIIAKNEALNIADCINSARKLSNDIIVVDSGSTDHTVSLARSLNATVHSILWTGYGNARNAGAIQAANDWIFALDADERITDELAENILTIDIKEYHTVCDFKRANFWGNRKVLHGQQSKDHATRLYNRHEAYWNDAPVHEALTGECIYRRRIPGQLLHYGVQDEQEYRQKQNTYAHLAALKYKRAGKKHAGLLRFVSPIYFFVKTYFLQLGILDGQTGYKLAKIHTLYTYRKYKLLYQMQKQERKGMPEMGVVRTFQKKIASLLP